MKEHEKTIVHDINCLPRDLGERRPIPSYSVNDQDVVQLAYIYNGPCRLSRGKLEVKSCILVFIFRGIIGLNISSRWILHFTLHAACLKRRNVWLRESTFIDGGWRH